jgi:hypothetical protein
MVIRNEHDVWHTAGGPVYQLHEKVEVVHAAKPTPTHARFDQVDNEIDQEKITITFGHKLDDLPIDPLSTMFLAKRPSVKVFPRHPGRCVARRW